MAAICFGQSFSTTHNRIEKAIIQTTQLLWNATQMKTWYSHLPLPPVSEEVTYGSPEEHLDLNGGKCESKSGDCVEFGGKCL